MGEILKWKELAENYRIEANIYHNIYESHMDNIRTMIVFSGILTKLKSDLLAFELKNGTEKTHERNKLINDLEEVYVKLSCLSDQIERFRILLRDESIRNAKLESENEKLKHDIESTLKAFQNED